ncbi:MAG: WD40 repeat domain-containing protein [Myxococcales bacterium]|nr:WD40 repeat domain-containing protein [Polyangiaceae bacterium]MDW8248081.1 WD40 repeat domain-containing protein [Myxococcales bacterium]
MTNTSLPARPLAPRWLLRGRLGGLLWASERGFARWSPGGLEEWDWGAHHPAWSRTFPCAGAAASEDGRRIAVLTPAGLLLEGPGTALASPRPALTSGPVALAPDASWAAWVTPEGDLALRTPDGPHLTRSFASTPVALAFAPGMTFLACACGTSPGEAALLFLDLITNPGEVFARVKLPAQATCLRVSPRGLVIAAHGRTISFWTPEGQPAGELEPQPGIPSALALDPSTPRLAVGYRKGPVALWNFPTNRRRGTYAGAVEGHRATVRGLAFVAGGAGLVSAGEDQEVVLWGLPEAKARHRVEVGNPGIEALALSPDGRRWVLGHSNGSASVYTAEGERLWTMGQYGGGVYTVAWSPDGTLLATGGEDGLVRLWGAKRGNLRAEGKGVGAIQGLAFQEGALLVADEGGVGRWSLPLSALMSTLGLGTRRVAIIPRMTPTEPGLVGCRALTVQGEAAAIAAEGHIFLGDGRGRWRRLASGTAWSLAFSLDGALLLCGETGGLSVYDARFAERLFRIDLPGGRLWSVALSPEGGSAATACQDGVIRRVDLKTGRVVEELRGHTDEVTAVSWSQVGGLLSAGRDGVLIRWERTPAQGQKPR